jgi:hypothetical protein
METLLFNLCRESLELACNRSRELGAGISLVLPEGVRSRRIGCITNDAQSVSRASLSSPAFSDRLQSCSPVIGFRPLCSAGSLGPFFFDHPVVLAASTAAGSRLIKCNIWKRLYRCASAGTGCVQIRHFQLVKFSQLCYGFGIPWLDAAFEVYSSCLCHSVYLDFAKLY